ncbi:MAG: PIN domain-containing protein [Pleurocapsa sp.]
MKYLLDTNTLSDYLKGDKSVIKNLHYNSPDDLAISSITKWEIAYGLQKKPSLKKKYAKQLHEIYTLTNDLPFDSSIAHTAGYVRNNLRLAGTPIGIPDVLIASTALFFDLTVITSNTKHFKQIKELNLINWRKD